MSKACAVRSNACVVSRTSCVVPWIGFARRALVAAILLSAWSLRRTTHDALYAQEPAGKAIYDKWCAGCHGEKGDGNGSAAADMLPRPRDFTRGVYQVRTTSSGELPTDDDLRRILRDGMPGTAMPGWETKLTNRERDDLVTYLKSFSRFFTGATPAAITISNAPGSSDAGLAEGRATFEKLECFKCHGQAGRGDGTSAPTLEDDWGYPIRAANLHKSWNFNGGTSVEEIFTRLRTGLDGTPMPSFTDVIDAKVITEEQLWRVAQYVRSLSPEDPPVVREVIRAAPVATLPATPADSAWAGIEAFYVPLVGQIIQKPRWFAPTVDAVWVRAAHDGQRLTILLTWDDPSKSPDSAWNEWLGRIVTTMTGAEGAPPPTQGPDRIVVQFPQRLTDDAELPYFLQGSTRRPAYLWRWTGQPDAIEEGVGTGLGRFASLEGAAEVTHAAAFAGGQWQVQFTRSLVVADTARKPSFPVGRAIPIAFSAADGSNGEDGVRGSVSAWYSVYLDVPVPKRVYVQPVIAGLITAGLGLMVVLRAQARQRRG